MTRWRVPWHASFASGDKNRCFSPTPPRRQVAVPRTSGRHTVARVVAAWPGWVRVEVDPGGASKDVPEGDVYRLLGGLRLA